MRKPELIFECAVPAVLRVNGEHLGEIGARSMRLTGEGEGSLYVECLPLSEAYEPFCRKVTPSRLAAGAPQNMRLVPWSDSLYTLRLCPARRYPRKPLSALCQLEYGEDVYTLCDDGTCYLLAETPSAMRVLPVDIAAVSGEMSLVDLSGREALCLTARGEAGGWFGLYELDGRCTPIYEGIGDAFRLEDGRVITERAFCDCACHRTETVRFAEGGGEVASRRTLSYRRDFRRRLPRAVVPFAFLDCVRAGASTAEAFLTEDLAEVFDAETAADYFGPFFEACRSPLYPKDTDVAALLYEDEAGAISVRHFAFELEGRRIAGISEK